MPPINQGARGTMIAWLVGTTVAAVAAIICAIYFYVESNRVAQESEASNHSERSTPITTRSL